MERWRRSRYALAENRLRAECRHRLAARLRRRPLEDQHPVEMVELVLHDARVEPLELEPDGAPVTSWASSATVDGRSTGMSTPWSDRHPSSSVSSSSPEPTMRGLIAAVGSSSSPRRKTNTRRRMPDLVGGEADAVRVLHQPAHPLDEPLRGPRRTPRPPARAASGRGRATGGSARAPSDGGPRARRRAARR